jgi:amino acid permease
MKKESIHFPNLAYIAAFVIGVILFAAFWKAIGGAASSAAVLAGMAGVVVAMIAFWSWNELKKQDRKDE